MSLQNIYKFFLVDAQSREIFNCITFQPLAQESFTSKFVFFPYIIKYKYFLSNLVKIGMVAYTEPWTKTESNKSLESLR